MAGIDKQQTNRLDLPLTTFVCNVGTKLPQATHYVKNMSAAVGVVTALAALSEEMASEPEAPEAEA